MRRVRHLLMPAIDRVALREGLRDMSQLALAISVWGLVTGVAIVNRGMGIPMALFFSLTVFAGTAQLAALPLLAVGAPLAVVWVTATLVNLRFVIFSAASRPHFVHLSVPQRIWAGYLNGDLGFALFSRRFDGYQTTGTPEHYGYFFGTAYVNYVVWHVASVIGIVLGDLAPTSWGLEIAATVAMIGVVVPMATRWPILAGISVTGVLAVLTLGMPMRLGIVVSVIAGIAVASVAEAVAAR